MGLSFLFTALVFLGSTTATDHATSAAAYRLSRILESQSTHGTFFYIASSGKLNAAAHAGLGQPPILLSPFAGVCFTMRTYKVKPTERLQDGEIGLRGYSTCQMGSKYGVRSADDSSVQLK